MHGHNVPTCENIIKSTAINSDFQHPCMYMYMFCIKHNFQTEYMCTMILLSIRGREGASGGIHLPLHDPHLLPPWNLSCQYIGTPYNYMYVHVCMKNIFQFYFYSLKHFLFDYSSGCMWVLFWVLFVISCCLLKTFAIAIKWFLIGDVSNVRVYCMRTKHQTRVN